MPETKTKLTFRPHDWFNTKTGEEKFGIEVKPVGMEVRYAHCVEANKPLLFETAKERDAKIKELRQEQNRAHPPRRKKSRGFTIKFGDDRRSQAAATHLLDALAGNKPSPTCATCGGITIDSGPSAGRCICTPQQNNP